MITRPDKELALRRMRWAGCAFNGFAARTGVRPFTEFTGLIHQYIDVCRIAYPEDQDFSAYAAHGGYLPMRDHQIDYINGRLGCIFTGHVRLGT